MVHYFYLQISSFRLVLSITIVLDCFYLLIYYFEKFSTRVWRLPFAINVTLNLSINTNKKRFIMIILIIIIFREDIPSTSSWATVSQALAAGCPVCGTHKMLWQLQADSDLKEDISITFYIYGALCPFLSTNQGLPVRQNLKNLVGYLSCHMQHARVEWIQSTPYSRTPL